MTYEFTSHFVSTRRKLLRPISERLVSTKCTFFLSFRRDEMIGNFRIERPYNENHHFLAHFGRTKTRQQQFGLDEMHFSIFAVIILKACKVLKWTTLQWKLLFFGGSSWISGGPGEALGRAGGPRAGLGSSLGLFCVSWGLLGACQGCFGDPEGIFFSQVCLLDWCTYHFFKRYGPSLTTLWRYRSWCW